MQQEPKWRRRAEDRPDEVLDAALHLFADNGFAATKVEDIALAAGISKGAIYRYFSSKEEVFEALVRRAVAPIAEQASLIAQTSREDPRVVLKTILTMGIVKLSDPEIMAVPRLVLQEAGRFPELAETYRREVIDRGVSAIEKIVQRGIDEGVFRPVNARLAVRNVVGPLIAHLLLSQIFKIDADPADSPQAFLENHFDLLINGLAPDQAGEG